MSDKTKKIVIWLIIYLMTFIPIFSIVYHYLYLSEDWQKLIFIAVIAVLTIIYAVVAYFLSKPKGGVKR